MSPSVEDTLHQELTYVSLIQRQGFLHAEGSDLGGGGSPPLSPPSTVRSGIHCSDCIGQFKVSELPTFLSPLSPDLDEQDLSFLSRKDALKIPDLPLRSTMVRGYLENLHPWMPFLDVGLVHGFLQENPSPDAPKISILLFQALMFAGSASSDIAELKRDGFTSRREARKAYYQRVRVSGLIFTAKNTAETMRTAAIRF